MITKAIIRRNTNNTSYSRGMEIYRDDEVMEFSAIEKEDFDCINAIVKGSGRNKYEVRISYDIEDDDVDDSFCECPAFSNYVGLCKHCVAVLLEYMDHKGSHETIKNHVANQETFLDKALDKKVLTDNIKPVQPKQVQTTPVMKQLLLSYTMKRTLPILKESQYGGICVEALLHCSFSNIQLEFKIGVTHMYVLKDVFEFAEAIERQKEVYYGQKLKFVHMLEAFSPESKALVEFILNWVKRNRDKYMRKVYYGYNSGYAPERLKEMPLTVDELDEFLDTAIGNKVRAVINYGNEKEWRITDEDVPRDMIISGVNGGVQVKINYLFGFNGSKSNIYFEKGKIYRVQAKNIEPIKDFLKCMAEISDRTIYLNKDDVPAFCRELLPVLTEYFNCKRENFDEIDYGVFPVSFEIYLDAPHRDYITCKVSAVYGDNKFNVYNDAEESAIRDQVREIEVKNIIASYCDLYDDHEKLMAIEEDEDKIFELLTQGIPRMQEFAEVYVSDAIKRLRIITAPKVTVGISVSGASMELKLVSEDMSKEQLIEILTKYNRRKKYYRLKNGDFIDISGKEIEALVEIKQGLHLSEAQLRQSSIEIPKYRALYLDGEFKEKKVLSITKDKNFKALLRNMKNVEDNDFDLPCELENILREYQKKGYLWIKTLKYNGFGGILADDMGLGKTLQVICFLLSELKDGNAKDNRRALVVCPASLVFNWYNEIAKFAPQLSVKMIIGASAERKEMIRSAENGDVLITSYDLLKRDIEHYEKVEFSCEVIDEAQFIKNYATQAAKAVKTVRAGFKLALTGTPIENRLSELWSIFDYLMPGFLYSYQKFREEFESPIVQSGNEAAMKRLQKLITPFVLRRLKKEVLTDLPDKLEESIFVNIEGEQQRLYDAHVKKIQVMLSRQSDEEFKNSKIQILSELTKLRQLCCDPSLLYENYLDSAAKIEICIDLINNAISGGHKVLLFSQFTSMIEKLTQHLTEENIQYYTLTGATSKENRAKMVENFNHGNIPVFCISLKAGGTGLNLTAADIVIHFDPWWNIAVQNQATDRAHRIGQRNVVNVYKLIVKGTIEENIMKIQEKKKELAQQVLSGEGMNVGSITKEELLELLSYK